MSKQVVEVIVHSSIYDDTKLDGDVSVDEIEPGLYLGNLTSACDSKCLEKLKITHILTLDVVPLPRVVTDKPNIIFKFIKVSDMEKDDLISHLPSAIEFVKSALASNGVVLVHCFYGMSRSASVIIAYTMEKYSLCYDDAYEIVRSKRRYVNPNIGFMAQLKLFGQMKYKLDKDDPRYKQFRLKLGGRILRQDLIKPDPALNRERPDPHVYRCKRCRRIVASQSNIIPHMPRDMKLEVIKKAMRPPPCKTAELNYVENGQVLIEKLKDLSTEESVIWDPEVERPRGRRYSNDDSMMVTEYESRADDVKPGTSNDNGENDGGLIDSSIVTTWDSPEVCKKIWFVEPMAWMQRVNNEMQGKLYCPQCETKIGSFSWDRSCKCPCGHKMAPAFYLVPSKVEPSNIVQNVQVTV